MADEGIDGDNLLQHRLHRLPEKVGRWTGWYAGKRLEVNAGSWRRAGKKYKKSGDGQ